MKLELPDNNASVLFHMGNALQSIARDIDTSLPVNGHKVTHTEPVYREHSPIVQEVLNQPEHRDALAEQAKKNGVSICMNPETSLDIEIVTGDDEVSDTIDADGLPWDQRIHSSGKTRLADNTWRMARKPSEKTDEEWAEYVEGVKTELKALMAIPVAVTYDPNEADPFAIEPPVVDAVVTPPVVDAVVTPPVVDAVVTPPVVIEAPEVVTPPIVIEAPEVVTPPVVDTVVTPPVVTGPTTFPELMKFITVNNKKLTKESVDEALKAQGLASIALLAARTDLIPQVHAALVKLL